ncbi:hypothetical protein ScPMuIL_014949 [Solemya velum]
MNSNSRLQRKNTEPKTQNGNTPKVKGDEKPKDVPGNAEFDPRVPLTARQRFNITKSWKGIARNMEQTGINMFLRLFETNDEIKQLFKGLQGYETAELRASKGLENHVSMVMYTLDEAIASMEDVDFVVEMLYTVGRSHWNMGGFIPEAFWKIEEPFLVAVKETLGDRYTANMDHIYRKAIKFILETLIEGFKRCEKQ